MKKDGKSTEESTAAWVFYRPHLSLKEQLAKDIGQSASTAVRLFCLLLCQGKKEDACIARSHGLPHTRVTEGLFTIRIRL